MSKKWSNFGRFCGKSQKTWNFFWFFWIFFFIFFTFENSYCNLVIFFHTFSHFFRFFTFENPLCNIREILNIFKNSGPKNQNWSKYLKKVQKAVLFKEEGEIGVLGTPSIFKDVQKKGSFFWPIFGPLFFKVLPFFQKWQKTSTGTLRNWKMGQGRKIGVQKGVQKGVHFGTLFQKGGGFSWPPTCGFFQKWPIFWTFLDHFFSGTGKFLKCRVSTRVVFSQKWKNPKKTGFKKVPQKSEKHVFFVFFQKCTEFTFRLFWTCFKKIDYREFQLFWG